MDVFEEMRIGLLVQRATLGEDRFMSARQFVKMATLDAARALGIDDRLGSLEPGKQADIIAVDLSKSHQIPTHYPVQHAGPHGEPGERAGHDGRGPIPLRGPHVAHAWTTNVSSRVPKRCA